MEFSEDSTRRARAPWRSTWLRSVRWVCLAVASGCGDSSGDGSPESDAGGGDEASDATEASDRPEAQTCTSCHGDPETGNAAPPPASWREEPVPDSHRAHLAASETHAEIVCETCHVVPGDDDDMGHTDSPPPAEVTWRGLSVAREADPSWDQGDRSCDGTYCHGETSPVWGGGDEFGACGSCHGLPPPPPHVASTECAACHGGIVAPDNRTFVAPSRHMDGLVDVALPEDRCDLCHGSRASPAPPADLLGRTDVSFAGVGAHERHLAPSSWHRDVDCAECHRVPQRVLDPEHLGIDGRAELVWGALASANDASPAWDGTTCAGVYCHGATSDAGGTVTAPRWTRVDGSQTRCGSCHGVPPPFPHSARTDCASCHGEVIGMDGVFADAALHMDGRVQVASPDCTFCHGQEGSSAPPFDTTGGSDTSLRGVGAHREHLGSADWHVEIGCDDCHIVPVEIGDPGHNDSPLPAELVFSDLAAGTLEPFFDGQRCSQIYCHGGGMGESGGGTQTEPDWSRVDGSQIRCGTCHGAPPGGDHPADSDCRLCHDETMRPDGSLVGERHLDGVVDLTEPACDSCHGAGGNPAPPPALDGSIDTTRVGVGAHRSHLEGSDSFAAVACEECHEVPEGAFAPGHLDRSGPADLRFGDIATDDATLVPVWDGSACSNVYCHGAGLEGGGGSSLVPEWTVVDGSQVECGSCHGLPPGAPHPDLAGMTCDGCHSSVMRSPDEFRRPELHVNGRTDF